MRDVNEIDDPEERFRFFFNPDDVTRWLEYSPEEFIYIMVNELRGQQITFEAYTDLIKHSPEMKSLVLTLGNQTLPASVYIDAMLRATSRLRRLLDTLGAYAANGYHAEVKRPTSREPMSNTISEFLAGYSSDVQAIAQKLRALVNSAMPQGQELLYAGHNHIGYSFTGKMTDRVIYICPMKDYVKLGFMRGTHLPDPGQLLDGAGKWLRHVKVRTLHQAGLAALEALVQAAWADAEAQEREKRAP